MGGYNSLDIVDGQRGGKWDGEGLRAKIVEGPVKDVLSMPTSRPIAGGKEVGESGVNYANQVVFLCDTEVNGSETELVAGGVCKKMNKR